ncbi:MAG: hypothetical protein GX126_10905 [Bacteroidales bacterium]|nr:hypothetical protein [Bacteroidales bacterium]
MTPIGTTESGATIYGYPDQQEEKKKSKKPGFFGGYETSDQQPIQLENETNQWAIAQMQQLLGSSGSCGGGCGGNAPQVNLQGLGAEGQQLLGQGMGLLEQLTGLAKDPTQNPAYSSGLSEIQKTLSGEYDPLTSPYYEGIRKEADIATQKSADVLRHGQSTRGTLASTVGAKAEGEMRAIADAKTLQTLGSLYESERNRMSNAVSQSLGYAQYQPDVAGKALSGTSLMTPLATYDTEIANQEQIANANLQAGHQALQVQKLGTQLSGLNSMANYGTYYMPEQYYQPGLFDYATSILSLDIDWPWSKKE